MRLHADAVATLSALPSSPLRDRFLDHLAAHPDGVYRTCAPGHLTASTLVLSADRSHVLLTLHAKARQWFQFGGHCEPGDLTLIGAAGREAAEESGLGLTLHPTPIHLDEHPVPFCRPAGARVPGVPTHPGDLDTLPARSSPAALDQRPDGRVPEPLTHTLDQRSDGRDPGTPTEDLPAGRVPEALAEGVSRPPAVTHHLDVRFLAIAEPGASPTVSAESLAVRWWPVDGLPGADPSMSALVAAGLDVALNLVG